MLAAGSGIGETNKFRREGLAPASQASRIINIAPAVPWPQESVSMQVSVESIGNLERRMSFSLPAERLDTHIGGRLRELSRTARIKGFRPGKVPAKVIEQRYGDQVRAEALDGLLRETFNNAVREQELQLAGNPRI